MLSLRVHYLFSWFLLLVLTSCEPGVSEPHSRGGRVSGELFYQGILFGDGVVADLVPEIRNHRRLADMVPNKSSLIATREFQKRVISAIQSTDADFFRAFEEAMRSGDPLRIDRAIRDAAELTLNVVSSLPEIQGLREQIRKDPSILDRITIEVVEQGAKNHGDPKVYERALQASIATFLNNGEVNGGFLTPSEEAPVLVAAVAIAITIVAVQSYALAVNIATAVNFAVAVNATVTVNFDDGGGGDGDCEPEEIDCLTYHDPEKVTLLHERTIFSIAERFQE